MKKLFIILGLVFSVNGFANQIHTEDCGRIDQSFREAGKQSVGEQFVKQDEASAAKEATGTVRD